jgi:acetoacetyl-CoA synthetase
MSQSVQEEEQPLWRSSPEAIQQSNLTAFMDHVQARWGVELADFSALYAWSTAQPEKFWKSIWHFCGVLAQAQGDVFVEDAESMETARFFPRARLNYAQNLLRRRDTAIAIEFFGEDRAHTTLTYQELYQQVCRFAKVLQTWGIQPGDRVAGYLPNMPQTIVAMLATTAIGAVWSSCSPDFGVPAVIDRFGQITPKVLLMGDGYYYGGKHFDCRERIAPLRAAIPSLKHVVLVGYEGAARPEAGVNIWEELLDSVPFEEVTFASLSFNHPLFILYSSGTTGVPKCIVHGAGGTLLQHLKEHQLHCDIRPDDVVFYYTTCGWMMWNWLVSALASHARLVLYDGSPFYPKQTRLFDIAAQTGITLFGTAAKYIQTLDKTGISLRETHKLPHLRMITSTGSPLAPASFDYVYREIKQDICLVSISGGSDIISCFALGNPIGAVWRGELQTAGLGMCVDVFDEAGQSIVGQKGELVCTAPFPCQPLGFWDDPQSEKYHRAYFARYPNVWHHGDFVEKTAHGGFIIHGRSDAVLNPGGVRIGTAEIYRQVEQIAEVLESIVVGQDWQDDSRIVLFVKLQPGIVLDEVLIERIKQHVRQNTTPRHVPAVILQVQDIPRTKNGKIAEIAVRDVIHGLAIHNQEALANPEVLADYVRLAEGLWV